MRNSFAFFFILLVSIQLQAQDYPSFEKKQFIHDGDTLLYRVQYPLNFNPKKKYPVLVFLHGSGERGNDNNRQLFWGGDLFSDPGNRKKFPAIIIVPQCPANETWGRMTRTQQNPPDSLGNLLFLSDQPISRPLGSVIRLLEEFVAAGGVRKKQIYIGGLSLGGMGTFEILWRKPGFFAAAFPICGGGDPEKVSEYGTGTSFWIFHGEKDPVVKPAHSRRMADALQKAGFKMKYSEYPGVMHDSWKNAFAEPELLPWIFSQKRKR